MLLTSTAWRNDHNGFSHQGPGLIQIVLTHRGEIARIYFPPDANRCCSVADHCLRSTSYVNLIVIDKQLQLQWLSMDDAIEHCARGAGIWEWAGNDDGSREPDIVLACAGDIVTMETVAAARILRDRLPQLCTRVVNVVDLMGLIRPKDHPHGMSEEVRRALHRLGRRDLRVSRIPGCDPPGRPWTSGRGPIPCPWLRRAGDHHDAVRHDGA